jgi:hypothetical protein
MLRYLVWTVLLTSGCNTDVDNHIPQFSCGGSHIAIADAKSTTVSIYDTSHEGKCEPILTLTDASGPCLDRAGAIVCVRRKIEDGQRLSVYHISSKEMLGEIASEEPTGVPVEVTSDGRFILTMRTLKTGGMGLSVNYFLYDLRTGSAVNAGQGASFSCDGSRVYFTDEVDIESAAHVFWSDLDGPIKKNSVCEGIAIIGTRDREVCVVQNETLAIVNSVTLETTDLGNVSNVIFNELGQYMYLNLKDMKHYIADIKNRVGNSIVDTRSWPGGNVLLGQGTAEGFALHVMNVATRNHWVIHVTERGTKVRVLWDFQLECPGAPAR